MDSIFERPAKTIVSRRRRSSRWASRRFVPRSTLRSLTIRDASDSSPASAAKIQLPLPYKYNLTFVIAHGRCTMYNAADMPDGNAVEDRLFWTSKVRERESSSFVSAVFATLGGFLALYRVPLVRKISVNRINLRGQNRITILPPRDSMRFYVTLHARIRTE